MHLMNKQTNKQTRLWWNLHLNTKLKNLGVRPGSYWVSPRAVSWVWGCRPPSLVVLSSILHHLFQEPCILGGHLAGLFPPLLYPSPTIFIYFSTFISSKSYHLWANIAPSQHPSLSAFSYPCSAPLPQPPCSPPSPLSPLSGHPHRGSLSQIAVP
jgi:hypothetical protein